MEDCSDRFSALECASHSGTVLISQKRETSVTLKIGECVVRVLWMLDVGSWLLSSEGPPAFSGQTNGECDAESKTCLCA